MIIDSTFPPNISVSSYACFTFNSNSQFCLRSLSCASSNIEKPPPPQKNKQQPEVTRHFRIRGYWECIIHMIPDATLIQSLVGVTQLHTPTQKGGGAARSRLMMHTRRTARHVACEAQASPTPHHKQPLAANRQPISMLHKVQWNCTPPPAAPPPEPGQSRTAYKRPSHPMCFVQWRVPYIEYKRMSVCVRAPHLVHVRMLHIVCTGVLYMACTREGAVYCLCTAVSCVSFVHMRVPYIVCTHEDAVYCVYTCGCCISCVQMRMLYIVCAREGAIFF